MVVAVVVIVFGMLLLIYNFCRRPAFDKKESFRLNPVYGQVIVLSCFITSYVDENKSRSRPLFLNFPWDRHDTLFLQELQDYYVDMENLEIDFDRKLGSGHFGVVSVFSKYI